MFVLAMAAAPTLAQERTVTPSGLDVPRFVSLKFNRINVRRGPGIDYRKDWVFVRKGLPVEVIAETEFWRRIRDWEGATGWVHHLQLDSQRTVLVLEEVRPIHVAPDANTEVVAIADPLKIGALERCAAGWCEITVEKITGWIQSEHLYGVYPADFQEANQATGAIEGG